MSGNADVASVPPENHSKPLNLEIHDALPILDLLVKRGYFHENRAPIKQEDINFDSDPPSLEIEDSYIMRTSDGAFVTVHQLEIAFRAHLDTNKGRTSIKSCSSSLRVDVTHIDRIIKRSFRSLNFLAGGLVVSPEYTENAVADACSRLDSEFQGKLLAVDLAKTLDLPLDFLQESLEKENLPLGVQVRVQDNGYKSLVSPEYWRNLTSQVNQALLDASTPVSLETLSSTNGWELLWTKEIVGEIRDSLPGTVQGDRYQPAEYQARKDALVLDTFNATGHLTSKSCKQLDLLLGPAKEIVLKAIPDAISLTNMIVHPVMFQTPLIAGVSEACENLGWVNLFPFIHPDIIAYPDDTETLLMKSVLSDLEAENDKGLLSVSSEHAIYVSQGMIASTAASLLPPLIAPLARKAAKSIVSDPLPSKNPRSKERGNKSPPRSVAMPIDEVASYILKDSPDLSEWNKEAGPSCNAAIVALSSRLIDHGSFRETYERAVQTELRRHRASTASQVNLSVENVQFVFEKIECFGAACFSIQMATKFIEYATKHGLPEDERRTLELDALRGPCSDFCRRITEYCLLKNEVGLGVFAYGEENENLDSGTLPYFCSPIDIGRLHYPTIGLSCANKSREKAKDPLDALRQVLPGSAGIALARMWILFRGEDLNAFVAHAEENCFTIAGLPFKKIDKKWEKQFLCDRKHSLATKLKDSFDPAAILELTIALLYQAVKNQYVFGENTIRSSVLDLLCQERKIPDDIATDLKQLAACLESGSEADGDLVVRVTDYGINGKEIKSRSKASKSS